MNDRRYVEAKFFQKFLRIAGTEVFSGNDVDNDIIAVSDRLVFSCTGSKNVGQGRNESRFFLPVISLFQIRSNTFI